MSLAINAHMMRKTTVMERYIAMESQIMKTWKAILCPASELFKPPGTVKAAEKVTEATSTAIIKITLISFWWFWICSNFGGSLSSCKLIFRPFSLYGLSAELKTQSVKSCMKIWKFEIQVLGTNNKFKIYIYIYLFINKYNLETQFFSSTFFTVTRVLNF